MGACAHSYSLRKLGEGPNPHQQQETHAHLPGGGLVRSCTRGIAGRAIFVTAKKYHSKQQQTPTPRVSPAEHRLGEPAPSIVLVKTALVPPAKRSLNFRRALYVVSSIVPLSAALRRTNEGTPTDSLKLHHALPNDVAAIRSIRMKASPHALNRDGRGAPCDTNLDKICTIST